MSGQEDLWKKDRLPIPVFQPGEFLEQFQGVTKGYTQLRDFDFHQLRLMMYLVRPTVE